MKEWLVQFGMAIDGKGLSNLECIESVNSSAIAFCCLVSGDLSCEQVELVVRNEGYFNNSTVLFSIPKSMINSKAYGEWLEYQKTQKPLMVDIIQYNHVFKLLKQKLKEAKYR